MRNTEDPTDGMPTTREGRMAFREGLLHAQLAAAFDQARRARGLTIRQLAAEMGTSLSQAQRVVRIGGNLTLRTLIAASEVLSVDLVLTVEARPVLEVVAPPVAAAGKR